MSDKHNQQPDVPIRVPRQSADDDEESWLRDGPVIQTPDHSVIVPVTGELLDTHTGINVRRFLQTAIAIATDKDGRVLLLGIASVENEAARETIRTYVRSEQDTETENEAGIETVTERQAQLEQVANVAEDLDPDVPVDAVVHTVTDMRQGILDTLDGDTETTVLLLRGTGFDQGWLIGRSTIDSVLEKADCDVFVENMGTQGGASSLYVPDSDEHTVAPLAESDVEPTDSILLTVGEGPHSALATEGARAVARSTGSSITVLHVVSPDASAETRGDARNLLRFAEYVLGPDVTSETELKEGADTVDAIVEEAQNHDYIVIGAPEQKTRLERLIFESVQETLSERSDVTVLMARDSDWTMRSLYYRWKRGIEVTEGSNETEQ